MRAPALPLPAAVLAAFLFAGCASTTVIHTDPPEAEVTLDGRKAGESPMTYSDRKIIGMSTIVTVRKEGYRDLDTSFRRNETWSFLPMLGANFYFPLLWCRGYADSRTFVLEPLSGREKARFQDAPVDTPGMDAESDTAKAPVSAIRTPDVTAARPAKKRDGPIEVGAAAHIAAGTILFLGGFALTLTSLAMDQGELQVQALGAGSFVVWVGGLFEMVHGFKELGRQKRVARKKRGRMFPTFHPGWSGTMPRSPSPMPGSSRSTGSSSDRGPSWMGISRYISSPGERVMPGS